MRIKASFVVAGLAAMLSLGIVGCEGKPPEEPKEFQQFDQAANGLKVSVDAFELTTPDYISNNKQTLRPEEGQGEVAIVRLKFENPTDKPIRYSPEHTQNAKGGVQLSTEPDRNNNGERTIIKRVVMDSVFTTNQVTQNTDVQPGSELYDDYLFENPGSLTVDHLVVLVPGEMFGVTNAERDRPFRFKVPATPKKVTPPAPSGLNTPVTIDGLSVVVTGVSKEYAELAPRKSPEKKLKYPYAYTKDPILVVRVEITNNGTRDYSYVPSHTAVAEGIILEFAGKPLKRIRLSETTIGAGQRQGVLSINKGERLNDVFFFEPPSSSGNLNFNISGHIFGVRGMYRYSFAYTDSTPDAPDLEPWKHADEAPANAAAEAKQDAEKQDTAADENGTAGNGSEDNKDAPAQ